MQRMYLPEDLYYGLNSLTRMEDEVSGFLVHKDYGELYVAACYITGQGSSLNVQSDPARNQVIHRFLTNRDFGYVAFHTHPIGTIRNHGEYFRGHFSEQDLSEIDRIRLSAPNYSSILFTPGKSGELLYTSYPDRYEIEKRDWEEDDGTFWAVTNECIMNELRNLEDRLLSRRLDSDNPVPVVQFY